MPTVEATSETIESRDRAAPILRLPEPRTKTTTSTLVVKRIMSRRDIGGSAAGVYQARWKKDMASHVTYSLECADQEQAP